MKRKIFVIACMLLFYGHRALAQELFIVVYSGTVKFNDSRVIQTNFRYGITRGNTLRFVEGASAVLFTKDKYFNIKTSLETTYSYADFVNKLNTTPSQKNNGFMAYLLKTHFFASEVKEASKGAMVAGVKGVDGNSGKYIRHPDEKIFPQDSVSVLSATVKLKWETTGKAFGTRMIIINSITNDTICNKAASNKGELDIAIEKEGIYTWFLYSKLENKKSIERTIIKPTTAEAKRLKAELENFKKQTAAFDEVLRALVLDDYLYQNHIVE